MEYKGVKYELIDGKWHLTWPSGVKTIATVTTEEELKQKIDEVAGE